MEVDGAAVQAEIGHESGPWRHASQSGCSRAVTTTTRTESSMLLFRRLAMPGSSRNKPPPLDPPRINPTFVHGWPRSNSNITPPPHAGDTCQKASWLDRRAVTSQPPHLPSPLRSASWRKTAAATHQDFPREDKPNHVSNQNRMVGQSPGQQWPILASHVASAAEELAT
jgi:hypothetical protein